jgi:putative transposase
MGEKRQVIRAYNNKGLRLIDCLEVAKISKSSYYFKPNYKIGGMKKTKHTMFKGQWIEDRIIVEIIKELLSRPFIDYGYRKVTAYLKREGYQIGKKKVYRLMSENKLLRPKALKIDFFDKTIIKNKPLATRPLEIIEVDIKYIYIDGEARNAYLITIYDVFHRQAYNWSIDYSMKTSVLIRLLLKFIDEHLISKSIEPKDFEISFRTDNGSQFIAKSYRILMKTFGFKNVYIPPATPQLNGHIESFHSTVQRLVCNAYELQTLDHAREVLALFYKTYNEDRFLTCLLDYPPIKFLELWNAGKIGQKEDKRKKMKFFFKEEDDNEKLDSSIVASPSFEVNLNNNQDFEFYQNKGIVNLPQQIDAFYK